MAQAYLNMTVQCEQEIIAHLRSRKTNLKIFDEKHIISLNLSKLSVNNQIAFIYIFLMESD